MNSSIIYVLSCNQEYIHRVGRTARGEGGKGNALLFLIPEELQFLRYLKVSFSHLTVVDLKLADAEPEFINLLVYTFPLSENISK